MTASPAWLAAVEAMLNRNLNESGAAAPIARRLDGRSMRVEITSLMNIRASVHAGRLLLASDAESAADAGAAHAGAAHAGAAHAGAAQAGAADAVISGSPLALVKLLTAEGGRPAQSAGPTGAAGPARAQAAQVRGDAEVANQFRELFKLARPDLEGEMSRFIGEMPARGLAKAASAALDWGRRAAASARANIAEYLQEESRDLVNKTELEEFLRSVDRAREAADRVEARLVQLERRRRSAT